MSGYSNLAEVREMVRDTLRMEGRDPKDYNITGIMRDAFHPRGRGYGYGAGTVEQWRAAVTRHGRKGAQTSAQGPS